MRWRVENAWPTPNSLVADAIQVAVSAEEEPPVGDCRGRVAGIVQVANAQHVELRSGRDHVAFTGAGEIDSSIRSRDRARDCGNARHPLGKQFLAIVQPPATQ